MQFVYAAMWYLVALILIFRMGKENKVFYFAGGFFFILGTWWLMNALYPNLGLFSGGWSILLRIITAVVLVILCIVYFREKRNNESQDKKTDGGEK